MSFKLFNNKFLVIWSCNTLYIPIIKILVNMFYHKKCENLMCTCTHTCTCRSGKYKADRIVKSKPLLNYSFQAETYSRHSIFFSHLGRILHETTHTGETWSTQGRYDPLRGDMYCTGETYFTQRTICVFNRPFCIHTMYIHTFISIWNSIKGF